MSLSGQQRCDSAALAGFRTGFGHTDKGHLQSAFGKFRVKNHADCNIKLEGLGGEANRVEAQRGNKQTWKIDLGGSPGQTHEVLDGDRALMSQSHPYPGHQASEDREYL